MKKIATGVTAIAAGLGLTMSLAFAPKKFANVFVAQPSGAGFIYQASPNTGFTCKTNGTACSISTTVTQAYANSHWSTAIPANSPVSPKVTRLHTGNSYQL